MHDSCKGCGTVTVPHGGRGYCTRCYAKYIVGGTGAFDRNDRAFLENHYRAVGKKISQSLRLRRNVAAKVVDSLSENVLKRLYVTQQKSLGDIAQQFGCSRVYVLKLCRKYSIKTRTMSEARRAARASGKRVRCHEVNRNFFKTWSPPMAYVLGFVWADGCLGRTLKAVTLSQRNPEILHKIKRLMNAEHPVRRFKGQAQELHHLSIGSGEIVRDLMKLGLTPNKSLTIQFPPVPDEFTVHFIRGVFDGDGTATSNRIKICTGSESFGKELRNRLIALLDVPPERVQFYKETRSSTRTSGGTTRQVESSSYYVAICARSVLARLYSLLYDRIGEHEYLFRKKQSFARVLIGNKSKRTSSQA